LAFNPILTTVIPGRITVIVEGQRSPAGNVSVALYNWQSDSYVNAGTLSGFGAADGVRRVVAGSAVRRFINGVGAIRIRLRSISGASNHRFAIDQVRVVID
jgi:hypothetical protein